MRDSSSPPRSRQITSRPSVVAAMKPYESIVLITVAIIAR
jgi:hypothetical protein